MRIDLFDSGKNNIKENVEIVVLKDLKSLKKDIRKNLTKVGFEAREGQTSFLDNKLYVGVSVLKGEDLKIAFCNAINVIGKTKYKKILISLVNGKKELSLEDIVEGLVLGSYKFINYKSEKKEEKELKVYIDTKNSKKNQKELEKALQKSLDICTSVNMVRDIVNTTPEDFYPEVMAKKAKEIALDNHQSCKVYGEDYLEENGMNAMLAVGRASRHESQLIHLTYKPKNPKGKVVFVGKGFNL